MIDQIKAHCKNCSVMVSIWSEQCVSYSVARSTDLSLIYGFSTSMLTTPSILALMHDSIFPGFFEEQTWQHCSYNHATIVTPNIMTFTLQFYSAALEEKKSILVHQGIVIDILINVPYKDITNETVHAKDV